MQNNKVLGGKTIFKVTELSIKDISWWTKFLLFFRPTIIGIDHGVENGDKTIETHVKELNGKLYVVDQKEL
jgi:hypothetical protein